MIQSIMALRKYAKGSLAHHPVFNEIHPTKNVGIDVNLLTIGSGKKIWWLCKINPLHEWEMNVDSRTKKGHGCTLCSGRKIVPGINDLKTINPRLASEWNHAKNTHVSIIEIAATSSKKVWWKCTEGHEWEATLGARNNRSRPSGCPYCSGLRAISGINDLQTLRPDLASQWDYTKNDSSSPATISCGASYSAWWNCAVDHSYQMRVADRNQGGNCPYCSGQRVLTGFNDINTTHNHLMSEWNFEKNIRSPNELSAGSNYKVWWRCMHEHEWESVVNKRTRSVGAHGCPYCSGHRVLSSYNSLEALFPKISSEWDYDKNSIIPSQITSGTSKKAWWKCNKNHSYLMSVAARTGKKNGNCPYCSGQRILVGFNDLETTHPALEKEWDNAFNEKTMQEVSMGSVYRASWKCVEGHSWKTAVYNRTKSVMPTGCGTCAEVNTSKIQQAFHIDLVKLIPDLQCDVRMPVRFRKRASMSVDMVSEALKLIVEYDGYYYHSGGRSGQSMASHIANDTEKTQALVDAEYRVVRIRENGLAHLGMMTDRVLEIDYKYGESMDAVVKTIMDFGDQ